MSTTVTIDPVTRIEGHLGIKVETENNRVVRAFASGQMFRGFEILLKGRTPTDAQQITQRICGVCPISHGIASSLAQEDAYGMSATRNGRLARNLILGANYIQSHILHFYHLSALDFVDITAITKYQGSDPALLGVKSWVNSEMSKNVLYPAAPFLPRYEGQYIEETELNIVAIKHYLEALEMRAVAQQMGAIFAGKMPHAATLIPGGVTVKVTKEKVTEYRSILSKLQTFISKAYLADVLEVASAFPQYFDLGKGYGNFLTYGVFNESSGAGDPFLQGGVITGDDAGAFDESKIAEHVRHSWFSSGSALHPRDGRTKADPEKKDAYSWLKAPRYEGRAMEVGPLARMLVNYTKEHSVVKKEIDSVLSKLGVGPERLNSVLGRHAARAIECKIVADRCVEWLDQLKPGKPSYAEYKIPSSGTGTGLTEAPRGALGHWLEISGQKISNYQCIVPTTWNCSPRDDKDQPGVVEKALEGTPIADSKNPIEAARVVRSFDPCVSCAVH